MSSSVPRRRPSRAVYRRRRLAVLILLLVVIGVVWLLIAQPWRGDGTAEATPPPAASTVAPTPSETPVDAVQPSESATSTSTPGQLPDCTPGAVSVEAVTDQSTYGAGELPEFFIRLVNSGGDCIMDVGTSTQSYIVTSGNEVYWRSTDCQTEPSSMVVTIGAGQTITSAAPVVWDRTRSSVDSCDGPREAAPAGGASYHLAVAIGGITSAGTAQFILN